MAVPDIIQGLEAVGEWETFWWGSRWEIPHGDIERALSRLDVIRNKQTVVVALVTMAAAAMTVGVAAGVGAGVAAANAALFELLKSRIKSVNQGSGVIVDFALKYSLNEHKWRRYLPATDYSHMLNLSNVRPR